MRLKENHILLICQKIFFNLRSAQLIHMKKTEQEILKKMHDVFEEDLKVEDRINLEAEKILDSYVKKMGDNIDRQKMFQLIKKQLIKDKNVVI
jgi:hypothetical protein